MSDVLLVLRDLLATSALLVGSQTLTATLVLLGATALATVVVALSTRWVSSLGLGVAARPADRLRDAAATGLVVTQNDPDAPGRARPRAPGLLLG